MKTLNIAIICISAVILSACAQKQLILTTPAVSMTNYSFPAGQKFTPAGDVKSQFCAGMFSHDKTEASGDESNIGFMDELVAKAQKESGAVYIANASFFIEGQCLDLEGTAMK
jgi:hypothetical protein